MDSIHPDVTGCPHSLDPLTGDEITAAAQMVRAAHDLGEGMRFETIALCEPEHLGDTDRAAFVATYDIATGDLFEAIVSLRDGQILSWTKRRGAMPRIAPDEVLLAKRIAKTDPRFVAAMERRGITDLSLG